MNPPATPRFHRMPGSAIIAVVFLWIVAACSAIAGLGGLAVDPPAAALLLGSSAFGMAIAVGVARRRHWARIAGIVLYTVLLALQLLPILSTGATPTEQGSGAICLWFLPVPFLAMRNTRLWCDDSGRRRSSFLAIDTHSTRREALAVSDMVELIGGADDAGLRAGAVGVVVEVRTDPLRYEVEFDRPDDGTAIRAVLRPEQVRPAVDPE